MCWNTSCVKHFQLKVTDRLHKQKFQNVHNTLFPIEQFWTVEKAKLHLLDLGNLFGLSFTGNVKKIKNNHVKLMLSAQNFKRIAFWEIVVAFCRYLLSLKWHWKCRCPSLQNIPSLQNNLCIYISKFAKQLMHLYKCFFAWTFMTTIF